MAQPTLHDYERVTRQSPGPSKSPRETKAALATAEAGEDKARQLREGASGRDEIDYSETDFANFLARDIKRALKKPSENVTVEENQAKKFLRNANVRFLGLREDGEPPPKLKRLVSRKESIFHNELDKPAKYTFSKTSQDATTAQLTTRSGFKIGVLAAVGGGVGGQALLGGGGSYSRENEFMQQTSSTSGKEMHVQVDVPEGKSVTAEESIYDTMYDADCDFDIIIPESHKIRYSDGEKPNEIEAKALKTQDDPEDITVTKKKVFKKTYVHLHRNYKCKIVTTEHKLRIMETGRKRRRDSGGNEPDT